MEVCPGINGKIASTFLLPSEDCNCCMQAMHKVPAQLRWEEGAQQTPALLPWRNGQVTSVGKNAPETQRQEPPLALGPFASILQGPAFPTTSCNLLLMAGGRFYTDHALRLPWVSLQDVSIRGGYAQIVAGAASHLPSSRGARTHEDDYNETEEPHMLAIINQHGSAEFLHKALLVCAAFAFFSPNLPPPFCNLLLRYVLENNNITFQSKELLSLFSWKVKWALNTSFWNELLTVWSVSPHSSGMCSDFSLISASAGHLSQWLHL